MNVYDAIMKRRTIRKFEQKAVSEDNLVKLVDCARVAAYGANVQPLKFMIVNNSKTLQKIYPMTKWAGYLADGAPKENERPAAYIAVLGDSSIKSNKMYEVEAGAAVTTMMLEAVEMGLGTCWLGAIQRDEIKKLLALDENLNVVYLLAVGYPKQESKIVDMKDNGVKYYEDENGVINVPKLSLEEILIKEHKTKGTSLDVPLNLLDYAPKITRTVVVIRKRIAIVVVSLMNIASLVVPPFFLKNESPISEDAP